MRGVLTLEDLLVGVLEGVVAVSSFGPAAGLRGLGDESVVRDLLATAEMKGDSNSPDTDLLLVVSSSTDLLNLSPTAVLGVAVLGESGFGEDFRLFLAGDVTWKNPPSNRLSPERLSFFSSSFLPLAISALF